MTYYEAIKNLSSEKLEKFLDQVFLTGFNTGYHSLVDPDIHDGNPFDADWLGTSVEGPHAIIEDEAGEELIIDQLLNVINRIVEFDTESISESVSWQTQIVLPRGLENE